MSTSQIISLGLFLGAAGLVYMIAMALTFRSVHRRERRNPTLVRPGDTASFDERRARGREDRGSGGWSWLWGDGDRNGDSGDGGDGGGGGGGD